MDKIISQTSSLHKGKLTTLIIGVLFSSLSMIAQTTKNTIVGTWLNQDKTAKIQIYEQGEKLFGKIVWLKEPNENGRPKTDNKNPNKARRTDPIIGLVMLKNFFLTENRPGKTAHSTMPELGKPTVLI